jgi:hypothetical protein
LEGKLTTKEIMEKFNIKNKSQVETWVKWYKKGEIYRFDQGQLANNIRLGMVQNLQMKMNVFPTK